MGSTGSTRIAFIVGAPRSGTNWLQRMLAQHPDLAATPSETMLFTNAIRPVADAVHHGAIRSPRVGAMYCDHEELIAGLRELADRLYGSLARGLGNPTLLVDRSPYDVFQVELIRAVYPEAPIVHMVRDGRDVVASLLRQTWGPEEASEAAELWKTSVLAARRLVGDPNFREVRYESLLADPVSGIHELLEWLGLGAPPEVAAAVRAESERSFNVSGTRVGIGKWRDELDASAVADFERVAGDVELEEPDIRTPTRPPLADIARRGRRRLHDALRHLRVDEEPTTSPGHYLVEQFLTAVHTCDLETAAGLLAPHAPVTVVTDRTTTTGRVDLPAVLGPLVGPLASAVQRRGDVHPGSTATTVVLDYELPAGHTSVVAVFEVPFDQATSITRLTWYQHEVSPKALAG